MTGRVYPIGAEWDQLAIEYVKIFSDLPALEARWRIYKGQHTILSGFSETVKQLMKMKFENLVDVYERFVEIPHDTDAEKKELDEVKEYLRSEVFNYDYQKAGCKKHQPEISKFFQSKMEELNVHTCYYCDMAYINPYISGNGVKSQFDLDHALSKADCPLVALSLHNFVPSCSVCNQRLKRKKQLSNIPDGIKKVAPCSEHFDADKHIHFKVEQKNACSGSFLKNQEKYQVKVRAKDIYKDYAELFHLEERYECHKCEALRLMDLKRKYPTSNIKKIARVLHKTADEVREDIFGLGFSKEHHRCMDKMKRDVM